MDNAPQAVTVYASKSGKVSISGDLCLCWGLDNARSYTAEEAFAFSKRLHLLADIVGRAAVRASLGRKSEVTLEV